MFLNEEKVFIGFVNSLSIFIREANLPNIFYLYTTCLLYHSNSTLYSVNAVFFLKAIIQTDKNIADKNILAQ